MVIYKKLPENSTPSLLAGYFDLKIAEFVHVRPDRPRTTASYSLLPSTLICYCVYSQKDLRERTYVELSYLLQVRQELPSWPIEKL